MKQYSEKRCGCGGIGRRAGFRCLWALAHGGSTPLIRIVLVSRVSYSVCRIAYISRNNRSHNKKTRAYTKFNRYRPRTDTESLANDVASYMLPGKAADYHVVNRPPPVIASVEQKTSTPVPILNWQGNESLWQTKPCCKS